MQRKKRSDEETRANSSRRVDEKQEQKYCASRVNQDAREVMSGWIAMKKLVVESVRHPRDRMPVCLVGGRHRPLDRVPTQPFVNVNVVGDVSGIVIVREWMLVDRVVDRHGCDDDQEADDDLSLPWRREETRGLRQRHYRLVFGRQ